jgi:hypothetical protein
MTFVAVVPSGRAGSAASAVPAPPSHMRAELTAETTVPPHVARIRLIVISFLSFGAVVVARRVSSSGAGV